MERRLDAEAALATASFGRGFFGGGEGEATAGGLVGLEEEDWG